MELAEKAPSKQRETIVNRLEPNSKIQTCSSYSDIRNMLISSCLSPSCPPCRLSEEVSHMAESLPDHQWSEFSMTFYGRHGLILIDSTDFRHPGNFCRTPKNMPCPTLENHLHAIFTVLTSIYVNLTPASNWTGLAPLARSRRARSTCVNTMATYGDHKATMGKVTPPMPQPGHWSRFVSRPIESSLRRVVYVQLCTCLCVCVSLHVSMLWLSVCLCLCLRMHIIDR